MAKKTKNPKGQKPNQNKEHPSERKAEHMREMRQSFPKIAKSNCFEKTFMKSVSKTQAHLSKKKLMKTGNCIELTWILASTLLKVVCVFLSIHFKSLFLHL